MMKTYSEFVQIIERYYEPDEKLASGKTPVEKATQKSRNRARTIATQSPENKKRWAKHYDLTQTKVKHGADNPEINTNIRHHGSDLDSNQRKQVARDARHVWDTHIQHRLPHGSVLKNVPIENPSENNPRKNTRAKLYQRAGFGEVGSRGSQFASVGREPSWKQKKKGAKRLKPMSGDTPFDYT